VNGQWCRYLVGRDCAQPIYDLTDGGDIKPETERVKSIGPCPYRSTLFHEGTREQKECSIAQPDPDWPLPVWNPHDRGGSAVSPMQAGALGLLGGLLLRKLTETAGRATRSRKSP
jgi:hypothetical protein